MVVPEDPTIDQYVLKPIVERLFTDLGTTPRVQVLSNPRLHGVSQALDASILADIVETNRMIDVFLVLVDRDGDDIRAAGRGIRGTGSLLRAREGVRQRVAGPVGQLGNIGRRQSEQRGNLGR